jgi:hypothetical protein
MIHYRRPPAPSGFPSADVLQVVQDLRDAVEVAVADGTWPDVSLEFPDHWGGHKAVFAAAQHHKCGWCEAEVTNETGAVDHHAPKASVGRLRRPGVELEDLTNVRGRSTRPPIHRSGYWWRAYDWDNWLYACNRCNSAWKLDLYPIAEEPYPEPREGRAITPLLLHPYEGPDPREHLLFDANGAVRARNNSPYGKATIATCGLDRPSLQQAREKAAEAIVSLSKHAKDALDREDSGGFRDMLRDLHRCLAPKYPFSATLRCCAEAVLGFDPLDDGILDTIADGV